MTKWHQVRRINARRLKARERAIRGWRIRHAQRDRLAVLDPICVGGRIIERWVRIIGETTVRERAIYEFDRPCDVRRKRRELFA